MLKRSVSGRSFCASFLHRNHEITLASDRPSARQVFGKSTQDELIVRAKWAEKNDKQTLTFYVIFRLQLSTSVRYRSAVQACRSVCLFVCFFYLQAITCFFVVVVFHNKMCTFVRTLWWRLLIEKFDQICVVIRGEKRNKTDVWLSSKQNSHCEGWKLQSRSNPLGQYNCRRQLIGFHTFFKSCNMASVATMASNREPKNLLCGSSWT